MLSSDGFVFALCTSVESESELLVRDEAGSGGVESFSLDRERRIDEEFVFRDGDGFTTAVSVAEGRWRKQWTMVAERGRSVDRLSSPFDV